MQHKYEVYEVKNQKFVFKKDFNPLTQEYDYHIWIRHMVMPKEAIAAYFTRNEEQYNIKHNRYEAFSKDFDITIYYTFLRDKNIMMITAFRKD